MTHPGGGSDSGVRINHLQKSTYRLCSGSGKIIKYKKIWVMRHMPVIVPHLVLYWKCDNIYIPQSGNNAPDYNKILSKSVEINRLSTSEGSLVGLNFVELLNGCSTSVSLFYKFRMRQ